MEASEIYPNAPLSLVAAEVRFPDGAASSLSTVAYRALRDRLGSEWVIEGSRHQTVEFAIGPNGVPEQNLRNESLFRITVRDRTRIVTLRPESLTIEVSRYDGYGEFRRLLEVALAAVQDILQPDGVSRLGLRYIDEIFIDGDTQPDWAEWIHGSLLPPTVEGLRPATWTGAVQYNTGSDRNLVLRFGPSLQPVVSESSPLRRLRPMQGPIFMLDFDSYWQPSDIPEFATLNVLATFDELRSPIRTLFDSLITPRLVTDVLRMEPTR